VINVRYHLEPLSVTQLAALTNAITECFSCSLVGRLECPRSLDMFSVCKHKQLSLVFNFN